MTAALQRLVRRHRHRPDDGFTLAEMLVSLGIMAVVMVLVTGAVLLASGTSARVDATSAANQQAHLAFDTLDRQVRWASGFTTPGTVGGDAYVEWATTTGTTTTCNELRLRTTGRQLQLRSWTVTGTAVGTPTAWRVLASGVGPLDTKTAPFTVTAADSTSPLARLRVAVRATAGGVKSTDTSTHDVTYTALNSAGTATAAQSCLTGRTTA